jgi:hypothetical protein
MLTVKGSKRYTKSIIRGIDEISPVKQKDVSVVSKSSFSSRTNTDSILPFVAAFKK